MADTEMMQRVVALLTQAKEMSDAWEEDVDRDDLSPQMLLAGELIAEALTLDGVTVSDASPQAVADAVMRAVQPRVGQLVACLMAAFVRLAYHHDGGTRIPPRRTCSGRWHWSGSSTRRASRYGCSSIGRYMAAAVRRRSSGVGSRNPFIKRFINR